MKEDIRGVEGRPHKIDSNAEWGEGAGRGRVMWGRQGKETGNTVALRAHSQPQQPPVIVTDAISVHTGGGGERVSSSSLTHFPSSPPSPLHNHRSHAPHCSKPVKWR